MKKTRAKITIWTIKVWREGRIKAEVVDTSDMPDDLAQGIDDYLHEKHEVNRIGTKDWQ